MGLDLTATAIRELLELIPEQDASSEVPANHVAYNLAFSLYCQALAPPPGPAEVRAAVDVALESLIADDASVFGGCELVQPPGRKWSRATQQETTWVADSLARAAG